ncbi:MAG: 1-acyl-sn-glycerol-3-phosphate acyltransferase [Myxococcales bacterium]|nr:1-acyl-sn-glycerol-3-phosphate acyltransferase [Myxococcales bacterium]
MSAGFDVAGREAPATTPPPRDDDARSPTVRDKVVSAALWGVNLAFLAPAMGAMTALFSVVPPDRVQPVQRWYCRSQLALTGCRWRAVVHPDVDPDAQYVFAQNHTNHFDHVAMYNATPHFKQGLELESHFKYPFYGWFMRARGTIPVPAAREGRTEGLVASARAEVERGHSILAFPEGTRTLDGRVGPFRSGVFVMAQRLGLPIVPVAVTGMYDVMRKGSWIIQPGVDVTVYVEAPVPTEGTTEADLPDLERRVHDAIAARVDAYFDEAGRG